MARYFNCVALPHAGGPTLPRFRMKRPPTEAAPQASGIEAPIGADIACAFGPQATQLYGE